MEVDAAQRHGAATGGLAMIAALALLCLTGQSRMTLIEQLGLPVDRENGYFDYLRAAEAMRSPEAAAYLAAAQNPQWAYGVVEAGNRPPARDTGGGQEDTKGGDYRPAPETLAVARRIIKMTPLEVKREAKQKLSEALLHVDRARSKRVWEPRSEMTFATIFPEFSHLRSLYRFLTYIVVDAEFADGHEKAAVTALLDSFRVGEACGVSRTLIGVLVAQACHSVSLRSVEKHISRFSLSDCRQIEGYATYLLEQPEQFSRALDGEAEAVVKSLESVFDDLDSDDFLPDNLRKRLAALPVSERAGLISEAKRLYSERVKEPKELFSKGEKAWATYLDTRPRESESSVTEQSPLAHQIVEYATPALHQVIFSALLRRIQMRLLRVAMVVMRHRWTHDRLPAKLKGIAPEEVVRDPVTGGYFQYRVRDQFFELIGTGARDQGEIKLVYRRASSGSGEPPPPQLRGQGPGARGQGLGARG